MEDNTTNVGALIPISENNGKQAVSARDLYNFLGCTERFQSWFERQLQYGFVEDVDYTSVKSFTVVGNGAEKPIDDYAMTIDMAKEVSMIQRSEKGKEARTYFIACEKKLKEQQKPMTSAQMFALQANINLEYENRISNVEKRLDAIEQERDENGKILLEVSVSSEQIPDMTLRDKIRQLVNNYASASNTRQQDVWHKVYTQLYYLYHISIQNYKKIRRSESKLEIAERNHFLDKIYNIISNMVREYSAA